MSTATATHDADARNRAIGVGLALSGAALFSIKGVVIKLAFAEGIGVSQLLTLRMAFSLPIYLIVGFIVFFRNDIRPTAKQYAMAAGLGLLSYYVSSYLNFLGLQYVSAQLERLILYIYPTMVAVLAFIFLKEKVTRNHMIALGLAYAGVLILFGAELSHFGPQAAWGALLIFVGAVIYAVYVTASRPLISSMGPGLFTSFGMSAAAIVFLVQSGIEMAASPMPAVTTTGLWLCVFMAIFCTVIPSFMIAEAIRRIGPGPMSAIGGVGPVVAAWAAVAILNEPFGWPHLASLLLTLAGVWLLARSGKSKTVKVAAATPAAGHSETRE